MPRRSTDVTRPTKTSSASKYALQTFAGGGRPAASAPPAKASSATAMNDRMSLLPRGLAARRGVAGLLREQALEQCDELVLDEIAIDVFYREIADLGFHAAARRDVADGDLHHLRAVVGFELEVGALLGVDDRLGALVGE